MAGKKEDDGFEMQNCPCGRTFFHDKPGRCWDCRLADVELGDNEKSEIPRLISEGFVQGILDDSESGVRTVWKLEVTRFPMN